MGGVWTFQAYCVSCWAGLIWSRLDLNELSFCLWGDGTLAIFQFLWDADMLRPHSSWLPKLEARRCPGTAEWVLGSAAWPRTLQLVYPVRPGPLRWKAVSPELESLQNISGALQEEMPHVLPTMWGSSLSCLAHDQGQATKGNRRRRKTALSLWRVWVRFVWKQRHWLYTRAHPQCDNFRLLSLLL